MSGLNLDAKQAEGGVGTLLNFAKQKLSGGEFEQVRSTLGGLEADGAMALAEGKRPDGGGGLFGAVSSLVGGMGGLGGVGEVASVLSGFKAFNLDADTLGKFVPIVVRFLSNKGGEGVGGLLARLF